MAYPESLQVVRIERGGTTAGSFWKSAVKEPALYKGLTFDGVEPIEITQFVF